MSASRGKHHDRPAFLARRRRRERWAESALGAAASVVVLIALGILLTLLSESLPFFRVVGLWDFLFDTEWTPLFERAHFGILPLLSATLLTGLLAMLVAVPLGVLIAVWLSEFASMRTREWAKPALELLSSIPTVVFGYFVLLFVTPLLQQLIPGLPTFNLLAPSLVIGLMIVPYVSSLSEDALRAVPMDLREAAFSMGAGRWRAALWVVLPAAASGVTVSAVLALSRALGETMVVAIAAGQQARLVFDPRDGAATLTTYIAQVAMGDVPRHSLAYQSLFAVGLSLFLLTLAFNVLGYWIRHRFGELSR